MKLKSLGANKTQLHLSDDVTVFFSYATPVAAYISGEYFKTDCRWSVTTSRHINQWLDGIQATEKPQAFFDELTA